MLPRTQVITQRATLPSNGAVMDVSLFPIAFEHSAVITGIWADVSSTGGTEKNFSIAGAPKYGTAKIRPDITEPSADINAGNLPVMVDLFRFLDVKSPIPVTKINTFTIPLNTNNGDNNVVVDLIMIVEGDYCESTVAED